MPLSTCSIAMLSLNQILRYSCFQKSLQISQSGEPVPGICYSGYEPQHCTWAGFGLSLAASIHHVMWLPALYHAPSATTSNLYERARFVMRCIGRYCTSMRENPRLELNTNSTTWHQVSHPHSTRGEGIQERLLDQVPIRISYVDASNLALSPGAIDDLASLEHFDPVLVETRQNVVHRVLDQKTKVAAPGLDILPESTGSPSICQMSRMPTCAFGSNSLPETCRLIF